MNELTVEKLAHLLRQTLVWLEHPEFNALPLCGSPGTLAAHIRETLSEVCPRCYGPMRPGKATMQTFRGFADFPGGEAVTMSPGGPGKLIDCFKCERCGHSVTPNVLVEGAAGGLPPEAPARTQGSASPTRED